jgi:hypothetical protein
MILRPRLSSRSNMQAILYTFIATETDHTFKLLLPTQGGSSNSLMMALLVSSETHEERFSCPNHHTRMPINKADTFMQLMIARRPQIKRRWINGISSMSKTCQRTSRKETLAISVSELRLISTSFLKWEEEDMSIL